MSDAFNTNKGDGMRRCVVSVMGGLFVASALASFAQGPVPATIRQVTQGDLNCLNGDWSPDGRWIVYQKEGEGDFASYAIWKITTGGGRDTKLTQENYYCDTKPRWGAKNLIAFQRNEETETFDPGSHDSSIWVMKPDGTGQRRVAKYLDNDEGGNSWPSWNPAGTLIAFRGGESNSKGLWWVSSLGTGAKNVGQLGFGVHHMFSWKPAGIGAGVTIAASFQKYGEYRGVARVSSSAALPNMWLTPVADEYCQMMPAYSPDGTKIAYKDDYNNNGDIWVMRENGKGKVRLTDSASNGNECYTAPVWMPGGKYIALWSSEGSGETYDKWIYIMTADGSHKVPVMTDETIQGDGYWGTDNRIMLRVNKPGTKILFNGMDDSATLQVFVLELDTADDDADGLLNWQEDVWGSDRNDRDSNDDGIGDGASVARGIDPAPDAT